MPIYAYKCESCGFAKDVLQKMSDPVLEDCPSCAKPTFRKQVTAAGFHLKGDGWYVTDFKGGKSSGAGSESPAEKATSDAASTSAGDTSAPKAETAPAAATSAPVTSAG